MPIPLLKAALPAVAKGRCDDKAGNTSDACREHARAVRTKAVADANVARALDKNQARDQGEAAEARRDTGQDTREAQHEAARERCGSLAGEAKEQCQQRAQARYGR